MTVVPWFQSPYGDYLVRNLHKSYESSYFVVFQSPYGDYLVRNFEAAKYN